MKPNLILDKTLKFSLVIIDLCEMLKNERHFIVSDQLLKSATSIGANVREAQAPESRADFIHKMKIAVKECFETEYWLEITAHLRKDSSINVLLQAVQEIKRILSKIIVTAKKSK